MYQLSYLCHARQVLSPDLAACVGYQEVTSVLEDLNDMSEVARKQRRQDLKRAYQKEAKVRTLLGVLLLIDFFKVTILPNVLFR